MGGFLLLTGSVLAAAPVPVSPGTVTGGLTRDACPIFLWSSGEGSAGYELVVYPVEKDGELAAVPALSQRLPAGAQGWTPTADRCLHPGVRYAWVVRDVGPDSDGAWSEPAIFEVTVPSRAEVSEAMETLRRYLAGSGDADGEEDEGDLAVIAEGLSPTGGRHAQPHPPDLRLPTTPSIALESPDAVIGLHEDEMTPVAEGSHFTGTTAIHAVEPSTTGEVYAVWGESKSAAGRGVFGLAAATEGLTIGVLGRSDSSSGRGVYGVVNATSGQTTGVSGRSSSSQGQGVFGWSLASTGFTQGVNGRSESPDGRGVLGFNSATTGTEAFGVLGISQSTQGEGVFGQATGTTGESVGTRGDNYSTQGRGVFGWARAASGLNYGVFGQTNSPDGYAGYFADRVRINGDLIVEGTVTKGDGTFKIDHPLDPAHRYLSHSFVESPDRMNVYDGNVVLDEEGAAWVELPEYFGALNRDFRYQLTALDHAAPGLHVAERIAGNRFRIAGGEPGMEVSWQVTGIRQDAYAEMNPMVVEEDKGELSGRYLHPEAHGQPAELAIGYVAPLEGELAEVPSTPSRDEEPEELASESRTNPGPAGPEVTPPRPRVETDPTEGDRP